MTVISKKWKDAWTLMRIPFSIYLMPVFWFALSNTDHPSLTQSLLVFVILHLVVYPASNGYNSYYDRDTGSIGGLKKPPKVSRELFWLVTTFDVLAIVLSLFISHLFAVMIVVYLLVSKAYSHDRIRLKKYPVIGTLVVTVFQGAFTYLAVRIGLAGQVHEVDFAYAMVSTLFLAGSYPLTQVYQHAEDKARGDITLSLLLGINKTFVFATIFIAVGSVLLLLLYLLEKRFLAIIVFPVASFPVLYYFNKWKREVYKDSIHADFESTMKMNKISSLALTATFVIIFILEKTKPSFLFWF